MKIFKYIERGKANCGVELNGNNYSVAKFFKDYDEKFFETDGLTRLKEIVLRGEATPLVSKKINYVAPIARPSKIVCIGLNYAKHAAESGMAGGADMAGGRGGYGVMGQYGGRGGYGGQGGRRGYGGRCQYTIMQQPSSDRMRRLDK